MPNQLVKPREQNRSFWGRYIEKINEGGVTPFSTEPLDGDSGLAHKSGQDPLPGGDRRAGKWQDPRNFVPLAVLTNPGLETMFAGPAETDCNPDARPVPARAFVRWPGVGRKAPLAPGAGRTA